MKNIKRITAILLVLITICTLFSGCAVTQKQKLIGIWKSEDGKQCYEFKKDGTCIVTLDDVPFPKYATSKGTPYSFSFDNAECTYVVEKKDDDNNYIKITYKNPTNIIKGFDEFEVEYTFRIRFGKLTLNESDFMWEEIQAGEYELAPIVLYPYEPEAETSASVPGTTSDKGSK